MSSHVSELLFGCWVYGVVIVLVFIFFSPFFIFQEVVTVRGYRPTLSIKLPHKARFCWPFKVYDCSEQFFITLFCTDCLITTSEGFKSNNELLKAIMTKHLCSDFAVILLCLVAVNEQGGL